MANSNLFQSGARFQFTPRGKYYKFTENRNREYLEVFDNGQWHYKGAVNDITEAGCMIYFGEHIGTHFYEFNDLIFEHEQAAA